MISGENGTLARKPRGRGRLKWLGWLALSSVILTGFFYLQQWLSPEDILCLTDALCFSSHADILIVAGIKALTLVLIVLAAQIAFIFMAWAASRGLVYVVGGFVMFVLGLTGIYVLYAVTPRSELVDYIHIIVIGVFFLFFGIIMFTVGIRARI